MLKKHMAACLVATAFMAVPAMAQTTPPPSGSTDRPTATGTNTTTSGSSAMQPDAAGSSTASPPPAGGSSAATAPSAAPPTGSSTTMTPPATPPSTMSSNAASGGGSAGQFMTQLQGQQMMASKLIGTSVVSTNNEAIGDVNDVIVDRGGQAMAVVIGVGGFLGIGEKDVAVPFQALDFAAAPSQVSGTGASPNGAPATTGSTGSSQQDSASNRQTATTGNTGNPGRSADAGAASSNTTEDGVPQRIVLKMTKAELQAAPTFRASGQGGSGTSSTPPRQ